MGEQHERQADELAAQAELAEPLRFTGLLQRRGTAIQSDHRRDTATTAR